MFCFLAAINSIDFFEEEYFDRRRKGSERAGVKFNRRLLWKFSGKHLLKVFFWRSSGNHEFWEMKKLFRHINWTLRHQSNILPCRTKITPIKCRDLSAIKSPWNSDEFSISSKMIIASVSLIREAIEALEPTRFSLSSISLEKSVLNNRWVFRENYIASFNSKAINFNDKIKQRNINLFDSNFR